MRQGEARAMGDVSRLPREGPGKDHVRDNGSQGAATATSASGVPCAIGGTKLATCLNLPTWHPLAPGTRDPLRNESGVGERDRALLVDAFSHSLVLGNGLLSRHTADDTMRSGLVAALRIAGWRGGQQVLRRCGGGGERLPLLGGPSLGEKTALTEVLGEVAHCFRASVGELPWRGEDFGRVRRDRPRLEAEAFSGMLGQRSDWLRRRLAQRSGMPSTGVRRVEWQKE